MRTGSKASTYTYGVGFSSQKCFFVMARCVIPTLSVDLYGWGNEQSFSPKFSVDQVIGELRLLLRLIWLLTILGSQETGCCRSAAQVQLQFSLPLLRCFSPNLERFSTWYGTKLSTLINATALLLQGRLWLFAQIKSLAYSSQWAQSASCMPVSQ